MELKEIVPPNLYETLDKAGICTPKQIILLSLWDIHKLTKLKYVDIKLAKALVNEYISPKIINGGNIHSNCCNRIHTGCSDIDLILNGGFRKGSVSEIYGESGSGKTQIGIQTAIHCSANGSVYICTEDIFPIKRFNGISKIISRNSVTDCGKQLFIEHLTESQELLQCIKVNLPKLLSSKNISLLVIDSVAAPFRCENICYIQRADELKELGVLLLKIAQSFNIAVVCINQVTSSFNELDVIPSLGLVWSNMLTYRFFIKKMSQNIKIENFKHNINIRQLKVVNAPDLPNGNAEFIITENGVENVSNYI